MAEMALLPITTVETSVALVTFFEDRAEVVRQLRCRVPAGRSRVHAKGLTLLADDRSLRAAAPGTEIEIVSSRVRRTTLDTTTASAEEIHALEAEVERLRMELAGTDRAIENEGAERRRITRLLELWAETVKTVPSRAGEAAEELARAYDALDSALTGSLDAHGRLRSRREEGQADLARAMHRLAEARTRKPRYEAHAEIEIVASEARELVLELVYRTPCALWRPEHLARLTRRPDGTGEITITTYATVWQVTGETWSDVPCRFSTARPARSATAPALREDVLHTRKKSDQERRQVVVEAREQTITAAGVARGIREVDEMPGVDDGGEVQSLVSRAPATIDSDGRPVRVEISERRVACNVARVAWPELGPAVHLRASATLVGPGPLLAGPVTVGRETEIVGRSTTKFVGVGEPFELGFGLDDGLRVRRKVVEKRKTTQLTGTQHVTRQVLIYVSNLSAEPRTLAIVERVPVSEVEDVVVTVERQPHLRVDALDGFATFTLDLPPRGTQELLLEYRIEAKSNVVLPVSLDLT